MIIKDDDRLICVKMLVGDCDILVYTNKGFGVRFNSSDVRETSRMTVGVKAISMDDDEYIIGMDILNEKDKYILALTQKGLAKKCTLDTFKTMNRADKPLRIITLDDTDELFTIRTIKGNELFDIFMKNGIESVNASDILELPRLSKGRKIVPVKKGDVIVELFEK